MFTRPTVAPVVQLVTSTPSDVWGLEFETVIFSRNKQTKKQSCLTTGERSIGGYTKFDFTVDERKRPAEFFSR